MANKSRQQINQQNKQKYEFAKQPGTIKSPSEMNQMSNAASTASATSATSAAGSLSDSAKRQTINQENQQQFEFSKSFGNNSSKNNIKK